MGGPYDTGPTPSTRGRSRERRTVNGPHRPRCAPGPPAAVRAAPEGAALLQHLFPGLWPGRASALPADGGSAARLVAGCFIVSEAVLCMGGPILTVGVSWLLPAGHGSHTPTMYHSLDRARPPAGGLVPNPGKNNNSPGW